MGVGGLALGVVALEAAAQDVAVGLGEADEARGEQGTRRVGGAGEEEEEDERDRDGEEAFDWGDVSMGYVRGRV